MDSGLEALSHNPTDDSFSSLSVPDVLFSRELAGVLVREPTMPLLSKRRRTLLTNPRRILTPAKLTRPNTSFSFPSFSKAFAFSFSGNYRDFADL
jgi:hypothetical protein